MRKQQIALALACAFSFGSLNLPDAHAAIKASTADAAKQASAGPKDLFYRQLHARETSIKNYGINYSIELTRHGTTSIVTSQYPFRSGDQIRFRVQPNIDGYMYIVLKSGTSGQKAVLFPDVHESENHVTRGDTYVLPNDGALEFDNNPGIESLELILSQQPFAKDEDLSKYSRNATINPAGEQNITADKTFVEMPHARGAEPAIDESITIVSTDTSTPLTASVKLKHMPADYVPPADTASNPREVPGASKERVSPISDSSPSSVEKPITVASSTSTSVMLPPAPSATDTPVLDKWAVVVGISNFSQPGMNLLYAKKDAEDFAKFLVREEHFAPDHVKLLTNEAATRANIVGAIGDDFLPPNVHPGDLVVIYIASHGTGAEDDAMGENYILTYDADIHKLFATGIQMRNFVHLIKDRLHTDRVVVVLDTCHSGATPAGAKSLTITPKLNLEKLFQGTGQLVVASAGPDQVAFDSLKYHNGLFTKNLIDGLRKYPDIRSAFDYTKNAVETDSKQEFGKLQSPLLRDEEWKGSPAVLAVPPSQPRPIKKSALSSMGTR